MIKKEVTVTSENGIHARPATFFTQKANKYRSNVWIESGDRRANAKSLLGVLSMGVAENTTVAIIADGQDEAEAVDGIIRLIESGFSDKML